MVAVLRIVERRLQVGKPVRPTSRLRWPGPSTAISTPVRKSVPSRRGDDPADNRVGEGEKCPRRARCRCRRRRRAGRCPRRRSACRCRHCRTAGPRRCRRGGYRPGRRPARSSPPRPSVADGNRDRRIVAAERFVLVRADDVRRRHSTRKIWIGRSPRLLVKTLPVMKSLRSTLVGPSGPTLSTPAQMPSKTLPVMSTCDVLVTMPLPIPSNAGSAAAALEPVVVDRTGGVAGEQIDPAQMPVMRLSPMSRPVTLPASTATVSSAKSPSGPFSTN